MAPSSLVPSAAPPDLGARSTDPWTGTATREQIIVEAWGQGLNVGALVFIILVVLCNYRRNVLLHKLILVEVRLHTGR